MRAVRFFLIPLLLAGGALLLGLTGTALRTGWIDPLDWLPPGAATLIFMLLLAARGGRRVRWQDVAFRWAFVALPAMVFCLSAGAARPWLAVGMLAAGLGLVALAGGGALRLKPASRWSALAALLVVAMLMPHGMAAWRNARMAPAHRPAMGVMAAVPLQGVALGAARGIAATEAIGLRSPLWQQLEAGFRPRPLDMLDAASLAGLERLLLIQPRGLAPAELVALDGWVRAGGRTVILADPLLHWPDARPIAHPARAPLTSLLDPLLGHWGLRLEPAPDGGGDPVERRWLDAGGLMQLAGASHFVAQHGGEDAHCRLHEKGLIARCRIGRGAALLVADADWIADPLWTLDPDDPGNRAAWTSDAVDLLDGWLRGTPPRFAGHGAWLADRAALLHSLRLSLLLLVALVACSGLVVRRPTLSLSSHKIETGSNIEQR